MNWTDLAQDRDRRHDLINTIMNLRARQNARNNLD